MREWLPGDLAYIGRGVLVSSATSHAEWWNESNALCTIIGGTHHLVEHDDTVSPVLLVMAGADLWLVNAGALMGLDELTNPGRLFGHFQRLLEP